MFTADVYNRFQKIYQERSTRFYDTAWAIEAMNDGIDELWSEIARLNPEYAASKTGQLGSPSLNGGYVMNVQEYTLPTDFGRMIAVVVKDLGGPPWPHLSRIEYWQKDYVLSPASQIVNWFAGGAGEPAAYYVRGPNPANNASLIGFAPVPSRNGAAGGVEIEYVATRGNVTAIDSVQVPDLPVDWHPLLAYWMAVLAAGADGSPRIQFYTAVYNSRLERRLAEAIVGRAENEEEIETIDAVW